MEFMLILSEDPDLVATENERAQAFQRVGEYAMSSIAARCPNAEFGSVEVREIVPMG